MGMVHLSLKEFVSAGWDVLEPSTPLEWSWHLDALCDHLQALILDGKGPDGSATPQNLLINVPPGTGKSLVFSVFMPAWAWLFRPSWRSIFASGTPSVVTRDSLKCRMLLTSDWYQKTFAPAWKLSSDQNEKQLFANTAGGFRKGMGAGMSVTGERADFLGVDDPNDAADITSKAHRDEINDKWWGSAFHNRIADPSKSKRGVIMQRLHEEDLAGYLLDREKGQWAHLCIPMEFDPEGAGDRPTWLGWRDPRTVDGQLLFPSRFTPDYLAKERVALGSAGYAGQMQQRPVAAVGNRFKRNWWRFWSPTGGEPGPRPKGCSALPPVKFNPWADRIDDLIGSWDCTFKGGDQNDWVVGITIARVGGRRYLLERFRKKVGFGETARAMKAQRESWPAVEIIVEDKANGTAVTETLNSEEGIGGVIAVNPMGGKEPRAAIMEPRVEAGNWYLPEGVDWLDEWVDEFAAFPLGKHDDMVDASSQVEARLIEDSDLANTRALLGMT